MLADQQRQELHAGDAVTYIVDRNINYTNVCVGAQPVHPVRVVSRAHAVREAAPPDPHSRFLTVGGGFLRDALPHECRRGHSRATGGRPVARDHGAGAPAGDEDVGEHDVRVGREPGRPHRAPRAGAGRAAADSRLHGVHRVAAPARAHRDGGHAEDGRGDLPPHHRHRAHHPGQRAQSPILMGNDGAQSGPGGAAVRVQRFRIAHDRGERGLGRRRRQDYSIIEAAA
jgi:hypothetical protein